EPAIRTDRAWRQSAENSVRGAVLVYKNRRDFASLKFVPDRLVYCRSPRLFKPNSGQYFQEVMYRGSSKVWSATHRRARSFSRWYSSLECPIANIVQPKGAPPRPGNYS